MPDLADEYAIRFGDDEASVIMKCMFGAGIFSIDILAAKAGLPERFLDAVLIGDMNLDEISIRKISSVLYRLPESLREMDRLRFLQPKHAPIPMAESDSSWVPPSSRLGSSDNPLWHPRYGSFKVALSSYLEEVAVLSEQPKTIVFSDLAAAIPVVPSSVYMWCHGIIHPISDHYMALCLIFPSLVEQPMPDSRDQDKPGRKTGPTVPVPLPNYFRVIAARQCVRLPKILSEPLGTSEVPSISQPMTTSQSPTSDDSPRESIISNLIRFGKLTGELYRSQDHRKFIQLLELAQESELSLIDILSHLRGP